MTLIWPGITALALLYLIAAWALVTGTFEIAAAIRLKNITGEWLLVLSGIASIALGVALVIFRAPERWCWSSGSAPMPWFPVVCLSHSASGFAPGTGLTALIRRDAPHEPSAATKDHSKIRMHHVAAPPRSLQCHEVIH